MALNQITDHIWLGSIQALYARKELLEANVTHIVSLLSPPRLETDPQWIKQPVFSQIQKHLNLEIDDMEDVDIMQYFDTVNEFIDDAITQGESVLVHCAAGMSRSVTCVCAYLMKTNKWDAATALEAIKAKRPVAKPNTGYLEQLEIYYESGYEVNNNAKLYREWKLRNGIQDESRSPIYTHVIPQTPMLAWRDVLNDILRSNHQSATTSYASAQFLVNGVKTAIVERVKVPPIDPVVFTVGPNEFSMDQTKLRALLNQKLSRSTGVLRCKSCSAKIASTNSLVIHATSGQGNCQHYFIEPVEWMRPELEKGELEGKLGCPKCEKKVGSYLWQGSRCTCGTWVTPSIKLSKAKVDGMNLPPLL